MALLRTNRFVRQCCWAALCIGGLTLGEACATSDGDMDAGGSVLVPDGAIVYQAFSERPCPVDNALEYEGFAAQFFQTYCQRCHSEAIVGMQRQGAPLGLNFDNVDSIRSLKEIIWNIAADSHTIMPPAAPVPTPDERRQLGEWLACDAPSADAVPAP